MKKIWLGIGAAVIIFLLLLQTKFNIYLQLDKSGYAIEEGTVKQLLLVDPEEEIEQTKVPYQEFNALEFIYQRGNSYYLGEKKKTRIDLDFPILINGGAGVQFTEGSGILFDVDFEEIETYSGLMISDRISYNPGGERADADEYLFCALKNGLFMNLDAFTYDDDGEMREVALNSAICFKEGYFTYCEPNGGEALFQISRNMADNDLVIVNGQEYTYHELLLLLHVVTDRKEKPVEEPESSVEAEEIPENAVVEEADEIAKIDEIEDEEDEKAEPKKQTPARTSGGSTTPRESRPRTSQQTTGSLGVRPDSARPDKTQKPVQEPVANYEKPTVTFNGATAGVYRIHVDVSVTDPAHRINPLRKVQFEFYEQLGNGKEQLVYRTYTASSKVVEAGNGAIKPDTAYRVNVYFTYFDEYNRSIVESVNSQVMVTTQSFDSVGKIVLTQDEQGSSEDNYLNFPYYYDNKMTLCGVVYDSTTTDTEAVYGINASGGMTIDIKRKNDPTFTSVTNVDAATLANFKKGAIVELSSLLNLQPNSHYTYTIETKDYFGNTLVIENNTGEFDTCKSRPKGILTIEKNEIGAFEMKTEVTDPDLSAIKAALPEGTDNYDFYYVISTRKMDAGNDPMTWADCQAYIDNGGRVQADPDNGVAEGKVHYLYRYADTSEYMTQDGTISINQTITTNDLDLNTKYYAYLICDYNLNNRLGDVRHGMIAEMPFTSATLSSLGNIYVNVDIAGVSCDTADIMYTLNEQRTNDTLEQLLSTIRFEYTTTGGEEPRTDYDKTFDAEALKTFTGWEWDSTANAYKPTTKGGVRVVSVDDEGKGVLKSMTDYEIVPVMKATYNGKEYDMNVTMTKSKFKTMRTPATVDMQDLLFAAGTLRFKVKINDPDGSITGNSGHVAVMNLYDYNHNFIRAVRYQKNTEDYISEEITGLDPSKRYSMTFLGVEYNEGYTNATFESNKVLSPSPFLVDSSLNLSGTIKLDEITRYGVQEDKLLALTKVVIDDKDTVMKTPDATMPYFVKVEKDGVEISNPDSGTNPYTVVSDYEYGTGADKTIIRSDLNYPVDKGNHTYKLTLYVWINGNNLPLDTLTFTSETTVEKLSNAVEFIEKIRNNNGNGKYCVTDHIDLGDADTPIKLSDDSEVTLGSIVTTFNGKIDFQGFSLDFNKTKESNALFGNIGPKGEIYNAVFNFKTENESGRIYDEAVLCRYNYGRIHDVYVNFLGGTAQSNSAFGLVAEYNTVTGIIERFVVNNAPEEGLMPFTARSSAGLVCANNNGIIRNGYVYGDDIYTAVGETAVGGTLNVGGVVGSQTARGQTSNVFSLVNVVIAPPTASASGNENTDYGSIVGGAGGRMRNLYGIGQSTYSTVTNGKTYNADSIGPVLGSNSKASDVYYWNEANADYEKSTYQKRMGLESLYDYSWQQNILGGQFDTQPVEVGFYPQLIMSDELPQQPFLELPGRASANMVEIVSTEVLSYAEDGNSALVEFRLSNTRNALITGITIDKLTTVVDQDSATSLDGFTTIRATVSDPEKFVSSYDIKSLTYSLSGRSRTIDYNPSPVLLVDFYRDVASAQDWYDYVVCKPDENARLVADIDFTGVKADKIRVTKNYNGKLDGVIVDGQTYGHTISNIDFSNEASCYVFLKVYGEINNLVVENMTLGSQDRNPTASYFAFVAESYGDLTNIHLKNVSITACKYMGPLLAVARAGITVQDCSANDVTITYKEPVNMNTDAYIGGLIGYGENMRINNCYVRNLNMSVEDVKNCSGAGGVLGYSTYCAIDSAYATGSMTVRGMNVGGIVGRHSAENTTNCFKNVIARVNVTSYQDSVGGLIGESNLASTLNERNNMTGVAFGNVFCSNMDAENVSYTVGTMAGYRGSFYGSDFQLFNGITGLDLLEANDNNTFGLISYEQAMTPSTYTEESLLNMDAVYDYSRVTEGFMPTLYYAGSTTPLPFQGDEPISNLKMLNNQITVTGIGVATYINEDGHIWMDLKGPAGYVITAVEIKDLICKDIVSTLSESQRTIGEDGSLRLQIPYIKANQTRFKDSYELTKISYEYRGTTPMTVGYSDFRDNPVRVPLTLYADISNINDWNRYINEETNYGNYDNYRIRENIDFSSGVKYTVNAKIGRLIGYSTVGVPTLNHINITKNSENWIFRLNSELSNLIIKDCSVSTGGRDCAGLIGSSAAIIKKVTFENITIDNRSKYNFVGIIGYQVGGSLGVYDEAAPQDGKIILKNIKIGMTGTNYCNQYVGGLAGYAKNNTLFTNIEASDIQVKGNYYVGGLAGGTAKASFDHIDGKDFIVTGLGDGSIDRQGRVGGIIGSYQPGYTATNSAYFNNVTLTGTPVYDADGKMVSSSTIISVNAPKANAVNVGGLIGISNCYTVGFKKGTSYSTTANAQPNKVDGIMVVGDGDYLGGVVGQSSAVCNSSVENSVITNKKIPTIAYNYAGGVSGSNTYGTYFNNCINTTLDVTNYNHVGLILGRETYNAVAYCRVEDSALYAHNTLSTTLKNFGGMVGNQSVNLIYSSVYNTTVDASDANMENVGGLTGYAANTIERSFYYAKPASESQPTADTSYYVKGYNITGGLVGMQGGGSMCRSYSNANVESVNEYAGGIIGAYENQYKTSTVSGKTVNSYSAVALLDTYFAGAVKAKDYAGGMIGRLGMAYYSNVDAANKASGGRITASSSDRVKSGSNDENGYTYRNLVLASTVEATYGTNEYAFCGNLDGFEGKANIATAGLDATSVDKASRTFFWEAMQVNGTLLNEMTSADAPDMAKNAQAGNGKRFIEWNKNKYSSTITETGSAGDVNVRTVSTTDLGTHAMYQALHWYRWNWTTGILSNDIRADYFLLPLDDTINYVAYTHRSVYDAAGESFLPLARVTPGANPANDWLTRYQGEKQIKLPLPDWTSSGGYRMRMMAAPGIDAYGTVYSVDVDKLNVEFSEDLVDSGYFMLYYGDKLLDMQLITKRAYSYSYDFKEGIKLYYGYADIDGFRYEMEQEGKKQGVDYALEDIFAYSESYFFNLTEEPITYSPAALQHHIMTFRDKYYYITEDGMVSGTGSGVTSQKNEDTQGIEDPTATTLAGDYITIYDGKALTKAGEVIDVEDGSVIRKVEEGMLILDNPLPLQSFVLNGFSVETYARFSEIISDELVSRQQQLVKSMNGNFGIIDGALENKKDSVVLYQKGEAPYCTILGNDGIVVDMYQGYDIGAPEDFRNSGIVYMTNNFKCSAPFILVEYANGGIVGYNYITGEYLFDHSVSNEMNLLDYAKVYFTGDKSELADVSTTYAANARIAELAGTPERLYAMVTGNSDGMVVTDNSTGEGIKLEEESEKAKATDESAKAGEDTALRDVDGVKDETPGEKGVKEESDTVTATQGDNVSDTPSGAGEAEEPDMGNKNALPQTKGIADPVYGQGPDLDGEGLGDGTKMATSEGEGTLAAGDVSASGTGDDSDKEEKVDLSKENDLLPEVDAADGDDTRIAGDSTDAESNKASDSGKASKEEEDILTSTAGTPIETDGVASVLTIKKTSGTDTDETTNQTDSDSSDTVETNRNLVTVYNQSTGTYEIVDMNQYLSAPSYQSENVKLSVKDLSVYSGYAEKEEKKQANGLGLYILVSLALLGGVGLTVRYRKRHKMK